MRRGRGPFEVIFPSLSLSLSLSHILYLSEKNQLVIFPEFLLSNAAAPNTAYIALKSVRPSVLPSARWGETARGEGGDAGDVITPLPPSLSSTSR